MNNLSGKIKILLVLTVFFALMVPSMAWAGEVENPLVSGAVFYNGDYTVPTNYAPANYAKSIGNFQVTDNTSRLEFKVVNGDSSEKNRVSSVKIAIVDSAGKVRTVAITPDQFNQKVGEAFGRVEKGDLGDLENFSLDIRVRGPKKGFITLNVTEVHEEEEVCIPTWTHPCP